MSIKLDLSQFKHIKSDKDSSTLQHKQGHILQIAHKALTPPARAQLQALSKISAEDETTLQADDKKHQERTKMADGGDVSSQGKPVDRTSRVAGGTVKGASGADITKPETWWAEGGKVERFCSYCGDQKHDGECYSEGGMINKEYPHKNPDKPQGGSLNYPQLKKEYLDKNKPKYGEHNRPKYADPQGPVGSPDDIAQQAMKGVPDFNDPAPDGIQPPQPIDPELQAKRDIYNQMVNPVIGKGGYGVGKSRAFGPNGEPPSDFDMKAWDQAEERRKGELADKQLATQQATQQAAHEAQAKAAAGITPAPILAPATAMPSPPSAADAGSQQNPQLSPQQPGSSSDPQGLFESGLSNRLAGVQQGAEAQGKLGEQQSQVLDNQVQAQQMVQKHFSDAYSELENERQAHMQDIKDGYIDPEKYWTGDANGNGSHSKLMTGIGMILAGFNPTNSPNAAINFLKFQMEQNLKSQEKNLDSKNNLLTANLRQFSNLKDATEMTRLMQHDIVANELQSAAAKAQSPLAKAAAMQAAGQIKMDAAPIAMTFAMQRAMMNVGNSNASGAGKEAAMDGLINMLRARDPNKAKEYEQLRVPGYDNFAAVPVPQASRDQLVAHNILDNKGRDLLDFALKHGGDVDPRIVQQGKVKAHEMTNFLNSSMGLGAMTADKREYLESQLAQDPTRFFNELRGDNAKLREVLNSNQMRKQELEKEFKLHPSQAPQPIQGSGTIERKDPKSGKIVIYDAETKKPLRFK